MENLLTTRQAAEYLGYSVDTLHSARSRGILAGRDAPSEIRIGRTVRYRKSDLDKWLGIEETEEQ